MNRLKEYRESYGLTQEEAVAAIQSHALARGDKVRPGLDQVAMSRHENDRKRPGPYYQQLYCEVYGATPADLGFRLALPRETRNHDDVDPLSRRSLFGAGVGTALGLGATTAPAAAARQIDPELVPHWVKLLRVLDLHDARCGPHEVLGAVRHEVTLIARHREIARGELRRQLLRVESRWAQFAGWLHHDAGDGHSRDAWADRALRLAREADCPEMVAYVLARQSRWAVEDQDGRRAIGLAEAARRVPRTTDQVRAVCALTKAQGHALVHDEVACERSLADARGLIDRADVPQSPWGELVSNEVTPPYVLAYEARCWLWLQPQKAIAMYDAALHGWPLEQSRVGGVQRARLARACAAAGKPERAAAEGIAALQVARDTRSDMTARELKRLDRQLAACDAPAAADFREAFATL